MQLVVGLGNPGARYAATRHNIGFRCLEALARELDLSFAAARPQYRAATGEGPGGAVVLLQPLTYMNRSGEALAAWTADTGRRLGTTDRTPDDRPPAAGDETPTEVIPARGIVPIVVCDDLHLPLGSLRIRGGGSDGGQNGLASILRLLGGEGVPRVRLGVGPGEGAVEPEDWADYVLTPFAVDEQEAAAELARRGTEALLCLLEQGWAAAASRYNRRILPDGGP